MAINELYQPDFVKSINAMDAVAPTGPSNERQQRRREEESPRKKVRDYFHPLSKAVDASNKRLSERSLPYRFKVYKRWGEVYLELFTLNADGSVREKKKKNISHADFNRIIDDVVSTEGLFFDHNA